VTRPSDLLAASLAVSAILGCPLARADGEATALHYQATVATQYHPSFHARYTGRNSLRPQEESATSVVMDLFAGARLWPGAEGWIQPELSGGRGLSSTLGVAAYPSGEVYRVGNPEPSIVAARAFVRQTVELGGPLETVEGGPNALAGWRARDALTITAGKVAVGDFFDSVPISNDPHTHFMSWGLFASGAYDYPADTRGYTWGTAADLTVRWWSVRAGAFLEPRTANGIVLDWHVSRSRSFVAEGEVRWKLAGRAGAARLLGFLNEAHMGSYAAALAAQAPPDVTQTRADRRTKAGLAASANQDLGHGLGGFLRASFNDGKSETWAFTEIDRSLAGGLVQSGTRWGRGGDEAGAGVVVSGLSDVHRRYLAAGGQGFILGDGSLSYAPEVLFEVYYRAALTAALSLGGGYQAIVNPAYNTARGPVHVFTVRMHAAL
jgi:high affinity Mn2+ porin